MKIGLLLSDKSIKIASIREGKQLLLKIPIEQGILIDGFIKDKEKLRGILLKLIKQFGLNKGEFVLGLAEKHIFGKTLTVSDHGSDFEEKIKEELESLVPSDGESYTDWQILEKTDDEEQVFVASVAKNLIDPYLELFKTIGLVLVGVEPIAFALSRHMPKVAPPPKNAMPLTTQTPLGSTLIVACEETEILLTIVNKNGGIELTSVFPPEMVGRFEDLLLEIGNIRSFYNHKNPSEKITTVYITGEGVSEEMKNRISSSIGMTVGFLSIQSKTVSQLDALSFFPVSSLVDLPYVFPKTHEHINLMPQDLLIVQEKMKKERQVQSIFQRGAIFLGSFCLLYVIMLGFLFWNRETTSSQIEKERDVLKANKASSISEKVSDVNKNVQRIKKFIGKKEPILDTLYLLADKTPGGIIITHYRLDTTSATLTGKSLEREVLIGFGQILEAEDSFQKVHIPLASLEKKGASQFFLSFDIAK